MFKNSNMTPKWGDEEGEIFPEINLHSSLFNRSTRVDRDLFQSSPRRYRITEKGSPSRTSSPTISCAYNDIERLDSPGRPRRRSVCPSINLLDSPALKHHRKKLSGRRASSCSPITAHTKRHRSRDNDASLMNKPTAFNTTSSESKPESKEHECDKAHSHSSPVKEIDESPSKNRKKSTKTQGKVDTPNQMREEKYSCSQRQESPVKAESSSPSRSESRARSRTRSKSRRASRSESRSRPRSQSDSVVDHLRAGECTESKVIFTCRLH